MGRQSAAIHATILAAFAVAAVRAAALPEAQGPDGLSAALAADDECPAGQEACALNALQHRGVKATSASKVGTEQPPKQDAPAAPAAPARAFTDAEKATLLQALVKQGVREEHLAEVRAELDAPAAAPAARANATCSTMTGGTCLTSDCASSRGATKCENFLCTCVQGFCATGGKCVFDMAGAARAYMPPGGYGGYMAPGAYGYMAPGAGGGGGGYSTGAWTGGTCMTSGCDASRGPTTCSMTTGYQCLCKEGFVAQNGRCVWAALGAWR